ncbi:amidophosphoribosyltransferase [candidate division KSB1 bacterium]|nr:amidophosphoribosyltransferase [candidate division KSB1 bacterium]
MGGFFGVVSKESCVDDLFYGTDYHSHLGTHRGGLATFAEDHFFRFIHNIENAQFRSKFENDVVHLRGRLGIGCISDTDDQPLIISSHLGRYAIVTVGKINNLNHLVQQAFQTQHTHFSEMSDGTINPTELIATLISRGKTFVEGIQLAQTAINGSCSILILTKDGIWAARDRFGRTPVLLGFKDGAWCATMETCALPNLGFFSQYELGPGEIAFITAEGMEQKCKPTDTLRICAFLYIYYGYPASEYEGINVEWSRNRCGAALARNDEVEVDMISGIPDSGSAHAIGYANESKRPLTRPFVKYTPTWPRSFMPQQQTTRDLVARMKLIPIRTLIEGKRLLFCEDSIVRGTQLRETIKRLYEYGAMEVHMRPACPPLVYSCPFLNFSRSKSELDLAARRAIYELTGQHELDFTPYTDHQTDEYKAMVDRIRLHLNLSTLRYQKLADMIDAISLPKEKICTYCWDGQG